MKRKYKKIKKSGMLYDYTPIGIVVVSLVTVILLLATSLLLYFAIRYGRSISIPMMSVVSRLY